MENNQWFNIPLIVIVVAGVSFLAWAVIRPHVLQSFNMTPLLKMMTDELIEAETSLLKAHTGQEYAASVIKYNEDRIARLKSKIRAMTEEKKASHDPQVDKRGNTTASPRDVSDKDSGTQALLL